MNSLLIDQKALQEKYENLMREQTIKEELDRFHEEVTINTGLVLGRKKIFVKNFSSLNVSAKCEGDNFLDDTNFNSIAPGEFVGWSRTPSKRDLTIKSGGNEWTQEVSRRSGQHTVVGVFSESRSFAHIKY